MRRRVEAICAVGNRYVGTDGENAARELVLSELERGGLTAVRTEPLSTLAYEPGEAWCEVDTTRFAATGLQLTSSGEVEGEAVYLGAPDSIDDVDRLATVIGPLEGRVAVVRTPVPFAFGDALVERGAAGVVVVSGNDGGEIGHFVARGYPAIGEDGAPRGPLPIPGVTISEPSGHRLLALLVAGRRTVRLGHRATYREVQTANVVGELRSADDAERVVVGAHYDTQLEGVGACDNATGLATLLELAAAWSALELRRSVVFVAFADEEHGCAGSIGFCRRHHAALQSVVGMVNLDALAWSYPADRALLGDSSILQLAAEWATASGWTPEVTLDASRLAGSDLNAFIDAGVPSCWLWRYPPPHPHYHSAGDTPERLDDGLVAETAAAAAAVLYGLTQEDYSLGRSRPARRFLDFDRLAAVDAG